MLPTSNNAFNLQHPPSAEQFGDARKIDVRPRQAGQRVDEPAGTVEQGDVILHFSCPSCLHMLGAPKQSVSVSVKCPECQAIVMPPQIVNMSLSKTTLPPPKKSGLHTMRKR